MFTEVRAIGNVENPTWNDLWVTSAVCGGFAIIDRTAIAEAYRSTLLAAIAVERAARTTGKRPKSWDDLVPTHLAAVPDDPFTDWPLKFISSEGEYVIYSVGMYQKDELGAVEHPYNDPGVRIKTTRPERPAE